MKRFLCSVSLVAATALIAACGSGAADTAQPSALPAIEPVVTTPAGGSDAPLLSSPSPSPSPSPLPSPSATPSPSPSATPSSVPDVPIIMNRGAPANDRCVATNDHAGTETVGVYLQPSADSPLVAQLVNWADMRRRSPDWYEIVIPQGGTGWVPADQISLSEACGPPYPTPVRIEFPAGVTGTTIEGELLEQTQAHYVLWGEAGQTMSITVTSPTDNVLFHIQGLSDGQDYKHLLDGELSWRGVLPVSQDYLLVVDKVGDVATYTIEITLLNAAEPATAAEIIVS